jgi:hypothetical protein
MGYYGYPDFQHSHVDTKMACPLQKNSVQNLVSSLYTLVEKGIPPLWIVTSGNPKKICIIDEWPELVDQAFVHQNFGHEKTPSASFVALLLPQRTQVVWINFLDSCDYRKRPDV